MNWLLPTHNARIWLIGMLLLGAEKRLMAQEPELPMGLREEPAEKTEDIEPSLPPGLFPDAPSDTGEPRLPEGLEAESTPEAETSPTEEKKEEFPDGLDLSGFWETRGGVRTQHDDHEKDASIGETRFQLETEASWENVTLKLTTDLLYDAVLDRHSVNLKRGEGVFDLREAWVGLSPVSFMDVKIGRQILTWGTGDLLFLNDLFPKDWQSFFIGRDEEYLKAPSDAIKLSLFGDLANLDVVFTPRFNADRFIQGRRLSYYNQMLGGRAGRDAVVDADVPNEWFRDHEWATRLSKTINGYELAAYGYWGYWKSPGGMDLLSQKATFPRLSVYGASVRGQIAGGIGNIEAAYYDSRQDHGGDNPFINNGQFRFLAGYERELPEITNDLTLGVQYYLEWMMDYGAYRRSLWPIVPAADERRHVVTVRVTKLLLHQNLELSLFSYYSPSDSDAYLRPSVSYKIDDHWTVEFGGNVFFGNDQHTFFNQFARNTNVYAGLRYGF